MSGPSESALSEPPESGQPAATDSADREQRDPLTEDFESKILEARQKVELIHTQRLEAERIRLQKQGRELRRQDFISAQQESSEKLGHSISTIEKEVTQLRLDADELEATAKSFRRHQAEIDAIQATEWTEAEVDLELEKALATVDKADDEFDLAANYFADTRRASIFNPLGGNRGLEKEDFRTNFIHGLAFNLPIVILGSIALLIYLLKS